MRVSFLHLETRGNGIGYTRAHILWKNGLQLRLKMETRDQSSRFLLRTGYHQVCIGCSSLFIIHSRFRERRVAKRVKIMGETI